MTLAKDFQTFTNEFYENFYYRVLLTFTNDFLMFNNDFY